VGCYAITSRKPGAAKISGSGNGENTETLSACGQLRERKYHSRTGSVGSVINGPKSAFASRLPAAELKQTNYINKRKTSVGRWPGGINIDIFCHNSSSLPEGDAKYVS
jgi:hypothetical protein